MGKINIKTVVKNTQGKVVNSYDIEIEESAPLKSFLNAWSKDNMDISHKTFEKFSHKNNIKYTVK